MSMVSDKVLPADVYRATSSVSISSSYTIANRLLHNPVVKEAVAAHILRYNSVKSLGRDLKKLRKFTRPIWRGKQRIEIPDGAVRLGAIQTILKAVSVEEEAAQSSTLINLSALNVADVERITAALGADQHAGQGSVAPPASPTTVPHGSRRAEDSAAHDE